MKNILVVEGGRKIAESIEVKLRSMGYKIELAYVAIIGIRSAVQNHTD